MLHGLANGVYNENLLSPDLINIPIIKDGLVLYLDAGISYSYPKSGNTWRDISGNGRNYTLSNTTYSSDSGGAISFNDVASTGIGPASNAMGLLNNGEYTIEIILKPRAADQNASTFNIYRTGSGTGNRGAFSHVPWAGSTVFFDTGGCCSDETRISYTDSDGIKDKISHFVYRKRNNITPRRNIFRNGISKVNSGNFLNETITWSSTAANLGYAAGDGNYIGLMYLFRVYNKALTDTEIAQNFNATKSRFGL